MKWLSLFFSLTAAHINYAQLYVGAGAEFEVQKGATLIIEGDAEGHSPITGDGFIIFSGTVPQYLNMNGHAIPGLINENTASLQLNGDLGIKNSLSLIGSNLLTGDHRLILENTAEVQTSRGFYIHTDGSGSVRKRISRDLANFSIPLGTANYYSPVLLNTSGKYNDAYVDIQAKHAEQPVFAEDATDFLTTSWSVTKFGVSGNIKITALYSADAVSGKEQLLRGFVVAGDVRPLASPALSFKNRSVTASINADRSEIILRNEHSLLNRIRLVPNPVYHTATLFFESDRAATGFIRVSDVQGRLVYSKSITMVSGINQYRLAMASLKNGVYHVQLETQQGAAALYRVIKADK